MPVTKCMICDKNLGHEHGNRKTCKECQKPSEYNPDDIWVFIETRDLSELNRLANLGKQLDKLSHEVKQKALRILEVLDDEK